MSRFQYERAFANSIGENVGTSAYAVRMARGTAAWKPYHHV
jgi:hypothetical protein